MSIISKEEIINIAGLFFDETEEEKIIHDISKILYRIKNKDHTVKLELFFVVNNEVYRKKDSPMCEKNYTSFENGKYAKFSVRCDKSLFSSVKNEIEHNFYKVIGTKNRRMICVIKLD